MNTRVLRNNIITFITLFIRCPLVKYTRLVTGGEAINFDFVAL